MTGRQRLNDVRHRRRHAGRVSVLEQRTIELHDPRAVSLQGVDLRSGRGMATARHDQHAWTAFCGLAGAERFLVWAIRWAGSRQEDPGFADLCLQDSFERAGLATALPAFRRYIAAMHWEPVPCPAPAAPAEPQPLRPI